VADSGATLSEEIFDISMAEIESIAEPHRAADDFWRKAGSGKGMRWQMLL